MWFEKMVSVDEMRTYLFKFINFIIFIKSRATILLYKNENIVSSSYILFNSFIKMLVNTNKI